MLFGLYLQVPCNKYCLHWLWRLSFIKARHTKVRLYKNGLCSASACVGAHLSTGWSLGGTGVCKLARFIVKSEFHLLPIFKHLEDRPVGIDQLTHIVLYIRKKPHQNPSENYFCLFFLKIICITKASWVCFLYSSFFKSNSEGSVLLTLKTSALTVAYFVLVPNSLNIYTMGT